MSVGNPETAQHSSDIPASRRVGGESAVAAVFAKKIRGIQYISGFELPYIYSSIGTLT